MSTVKPDSFVTNFTRLGSGGGLLQGAIARHFVDRISKMKWFGGEGVVSQGPVKFVEFSLFYV